MMRQQYERYTYTRAIHAMRLLHNGNRKKAKRELAKRLENVRALTREILPSMEENAYPRDVVVQFLRLAFPREFPFEVSDMLIRYVIREVSRERALEATEKDPAPI